MNNISINDVFNTMKDSDYLVLIYGSDNDSISLEFENNSDKLTVTEEMKKAFSDEFKINILKLALKKGLIYVENGKFEFVKNTGDLSDNLIIVLKKIDKNDSAVSKAEIDASYYIHNYINSIVHKLYSSKNETYQNLNSIILGCQKHLEEKGIILLKEIEDRINYVADSVNYEFSFFGILIFFSLSGTERLSKFARIWLDRNKEEKEYFFCYYIAKLISEKLNEGTNKGTEYDKYSAYRRCFFEYDFVVNPRIEKKIKSMFSEDIRDDTINQIISSQRDLYNKEYNEITDTIEIKDDNIEDLRKAYPDGLHFVVGDVHGHTDTLKALMNKIQFNPEKDHVYFVGDYYNGGNTNSLLSYLSEYFSCDYDNPGFHMIRGNHEWWNARLNNLPDIMIIKMKEKTFCISHASFAPEVYNVVSQDIQNQASIGLNKAVYSYKFDSENINSKKPSNAEKCWRMICTSKGNFISQSQKYIGTINDDNICVIHGHTPFIMFSNVPYSEKSGYCTSKKYGDKNMFWINQHIWFSEELQSFDIDANIKAEKKNSKAPSGLACICLEVYDNKGKITRETIKSSANGVFYVDKVNETDENCPEVDTSKFKSEYKTITVENDEIKFKDENV